MEQPGNYLASLLKRKSTTEAVQQKKSKYQPRTTFLKKYFNETESSNASGVEEDADNDQYVVEIDPLDEDTASSDGKPHTTMQVKTKPAPSQKDHIDAFLESLTPTLLSFTAYNLNIAKSKIFAAVQQVELEMIMDNQTASPNMQPIMSKPANDPVGSFIFVIKTTLKGFSAYHQSVAKAKVFSVVSELELEQIKRAEEVAVRPIKMETDLNDYAAKLRRMNEEQRKLSEVIINKVLTKGIANDLRSSDVDNFFRNSAADTTEGETSINEDETQVVFR